MERFCLVSVCLTCLGLVQSIFLGLENGHSGQIEGFEEGFTNDIILAIIIASIIPPIGVIVLMLVSGLNADPKFGEYLPRF